MGCVCRSLASWPDEWPNAELSQNENNTESDKKIIDGEILNKEKDKNEL